MYNTIPGPTWYLTNPIQANANRVSKRLAPKCWEHNHYSKNCATCTFVAYLNELLKIRSNSRASAHRNR